MTFIVLGLLILLTFYVAWNLGANDVANSMGTSVGSKAITLKQAIIIAGILEFTGALIFGQPVAATLATKVANVSLFSATPELLIMGMISVLLACGIWLQIATNKGLPVASSHSIVGAIAGFSLVAVGVSGVDWQNLGLISLAWLVTPIISGLIAILFYSLVKFWIVEQVESIQQLKEWIPWLSSILFGLFGVIVFPNLWQYSWFDQITIPRYDLSLILGAMAAIILTFSSWAYLDRLCHQEDINQKQILELVLGKFQIVSACFVAFAHGSNDVGNAIAPLAVIVNVMKNITISPATFVIPHWVLIVGGLGIVAGLAVEGKKVITTIGEGIINLEPSSGFSAEIATATTILIASYLGFPVSTSHALVGGVVGIGLAKGWQNLSFSTIKSVILAWVITLPITALIGAISFYGLRLFLNHLTSDS